MGVRVTISDWKEYVTRQGHDAIGERCSYERVLEEFQTRIFKTEEEANDWLDLFFSHDHNYVIRVTELEEKGE